MRIDLLFAAAVSPDFVCLTLIGRLFLITSLSLYSVVGYCVIGVVGHLVDIRLAPLQIDQDSVEDGCFTSESLV